MKKMTVTAKRDFQVRSKSILNDTNLARKTTTASGEANWEAFESKEELFATLSSDDLLKLANENALAKAKSEAKTSSPWTDIETVVAAVVKMKKLTAQDALDFLVGAGIVNIPDFTETTEEVDEEDEEETEEVVG